MLKPISIEALQGLAENATHLARIIRQWLPVTGDAEAKTASRRTAERWFYQAAEHFTVCERIRNPHKLAFNQRGGFYFGPSACSAAWSELESAIDGIAVAYRLQPVADESGIPHLPFEQDVPAIDAATLKRLDLAASAILETVRNDPPNAKSGAPLFKKNPPFGRRVSIDVKNAVNTFMAEWRPGLNKEEWCDEYRKSVNRPDWNLRKILYDYLIFSDS